MANINQFAAFEVSRNRDFDYDTGAKYRIVYAGTATQLNAIAQYWESQNNEEGSPLGYGYRTSFIHAAGSMLLTVTIPDEILYFTRWDIDSCTRPISMWWVPEVREFLGDGAIDFSTAVGVRQWLIHVAKIQRIFNNINNPLADITEETFTATTQKEAELILSMMRDGETREYKQATLQRRRTIPFALFEGRVRLVGRPQLYSLDGIYNLFGLDNSTYDQAVTIYENLPPADPNTKWSWKLGADRSGKVVGSGKVEECREWMFGRWDTITNTFIS